MITDRQVRRLRTLLVRGETLSRAAWKTGMDRRTARKYRTGKLPSEQAAEHDGCEDALAAVALLQDRELAGARRLLRAARNPLAHRARERVRARTGGDDRPKVELYDPYDEPLPLDQRNKKHTKKMKSSKGGHSSTPFISEPARKKKHLGAKKDGSSSGGKGVDKQRVNDLLRLNQKKHYKH